MLPRASAFSLRIGWALAIASLLAACARECAVAASAPTGVDRAQTREGSWLNGQLAGEGGDLAFRADTDPARRLDWSEIRRIELSSIDSRGPVDAVRPFVVTLADGGRISARAVRLDETALAVDSGVEDRPWVIPRVWVRSIAQRPGESVALTETTDPFSGPSWERSGSVEAVDGRGAAGRPELRLGLPGGVARHRLGEPLWSGRLEITYDDGGRSSNQRWWLELGFRVPGRDTASIRIVPGWSESTLSVESRGGPSLAVQRLVRKPGTHHLVVRFSPERSDVSLDGDDLAHGEGPGGPLVEFAMESQAGGAGDVQPAPSVRIDSVRLVRRLEPSARPEVDLTLEALTRIDGDQLFGAVRSLNPRAVRFETTLGGPAHLLAWKDVSAVALRRRPVPPVVLSGALARISWGAAVGHAEESLDQIEAVVLSVDAEHVRLHSPAIGSITLPRGAVRSIEPRGAGIRWILDPWPHHLGNRIDPDLDPPSPDGSTLDLEFGLDAEPGEPAALVLDVVGVVGVEGTPVHSDRVREGELRTTLELNERRLPDLNEAIHAPNTERARIRLALPAGLLKRGQNRLRMGQTGTGDNPEKRDNLSVLAIALEWTSVDRSAGAGERRRGAGGRP
jgi:hypothetical protein